MTISPAILTPSAQLTNAAASIYTVPANGKAVIKRAVFTNVDTVTRLLTVHRVASGGSATTANQVITTQRLTPGEAYVAAELANMVLDAGDSIQALADANTAVNATMSGYTL